MSRGGIILTLLLLPLAALLGAWWALDDDVFTPLRLAGGPLLVALLLGALGRTGPLVWSLPYSANLTLRQIGLVTAPEEAHMAGVEDLLGHKGGEWQEHIHAALAGETDSLETRFYLGLLGRDPVANIMTVESRGVGWLGHVYTRPEHRRKGICRAVMGRQMR